MTEEFKPDVSFDDFMKLDLRVAKIIEATPVEKTDKLMCLKVDLGSEQRQIVAGIKQYFSPETLVGRSIVIVANLAPRTLRGLESHGMVLAASFFSEVAGEPNLSLIEPTINGTTPGTSVH